MSSDLFIVKENENDLQGHMWYLVGIIQMKTGLSVISIVTYLKNLCIELKTNRIPVNVIESIESYLYEGQLGKAKASLENYIEENKNSKFLLEQDLLDLIAEMKNDPSHIEKLEPKLEYQSSFTCCICERYVINSDIMILEDCPHTFHKNCISKNVEDQLLAVQELIICPAKDCKKEIQFHHLGQYASDDVIKRYQELSMEKIISSGKFGKIMECPNKNCKVKFSVDGDTGYCPACGAGICGKCGMLLDKCVCNAVVMKRQCPDCLLWVEKGKDKFTKCLKCGIFFCFDCMKKPVQCKCKKK